MLDFNAGEVSEKDLRNREHQRRWRERQREAMELRQDDPLNLEARSWMGEVAGTLSANFGVVCGACLYEVAGE
jgi:hypothetical protein